jgi:hypothetical protein
VVNGLADGAERIVSATGVGSPPERHFTRRYLVGFRHYLASFKTEHSKDRFRAEIAATKSDEAPSPEAVRARQAIQDASVLIAVWKLGRFAIQASAGPLIAYALEESGRTVYWIDPESGAVTCYDNRDGFIDSIRHLNFYNAAYTGMGEIGFDIEQQIEALEKLAVECEIDPEALKPLQPRVIRHFVRASKLASKWQRWHVRAGALIYLLAAVAVANAAVGSLFHLGMRAVLAEAVEMGLILIAIGVSEVGEWLRRWLDYRFLAERLRATIFLYLAGIACELPEAEEPVPWMVRALESIRDAAVRPLNPGSVSAVRKFVLEGWILDQKAYYKRRGKEFRTKHEIFAALGIALFLATAVAALVHLLTDWERGEPWFEAAGIILPAAGAAVAGFRAFREYHRASLQYGAMERSLEKLRGDADKIATAGDLVRYLQDVDHAVMREHQGWRFLVDVHEPREAI